MKQSIHIIDLYSCQIVETIGLLNFLHCSKINFQIFFFVVLCFLHLLILVWFQCVLLHFQKAVWLRLVVTVLEIQVVQHCLDRMKTLESVDTLESHILSLLLMIYQQGLSSHPVAKSLNVHTTTAWAMLNRCFYHNTLNLVKKKNAREYTFLSYLIGRYSNITSYSNFLLF